MAVSYLDFKRFSEQAIPVENYMAEEICLRVIVSASYYAIYHRALNFSSLTRSIPLSEIAGPSHKKLSDFYVDPYDIRKDLKINADIKFKMRRIGYVLKTLHARRVLADYKIDDEVSMIDMQDVVSQSDKYIKVIDEIVDAL